MASSGNFCTLNPLTQYHSQTVNGTFSNGNLTYAMSGLDSHGATMDMTVKTYCEVRIDSIGGYGGVLGFRTMDVIAQVNDSVTFQMNYQSGKIYHNKGTSLQSVSIANIGGTVSAGNIVMFAYDPATYKWWVGVNGTWRNSGDPANGTGYVFEGSATMFENMSAGISWGGWKGDANGLTSTWNFGQDSTFSGQETAGGNADGNGFGDFAYSPPTGFLAHCTGNMSVSDDVDPAQTDDDFPSKQFNTVLYTGNASSNRSVSGVGFKPDLIWGHSRTGTTVSYLYDSNRDGKVLRSETTDAEADYSSYWSQFDSDGWTFGNNASSQNENTKTFVTWCWRANGGTTSSNSEGDITSTVQANTKAGFSIVTYTGDRTGTGVSTVGHGLSSAPDMVITKSRSNSGNWWVQHIETSSASTMLNLQSDSAATDKSGNGTLSRPTATVFGTNFTDGLGTNGQTHIAYCWHNVEGFQKFGKYTGNGSTDGPFIYTGFRPRMLFIKKTSAASWYVLDTARGTYNPITTLLNWDTTSSESNIGSANNFDVLSNGLKIRTSGGGLNGSGGTFVYGAWADVPFKYNNTF
jgi:hypothetical protein